MRGREGDLIKTKNQLIFDVKGLIHPPNKLVAFPRYIPSYEGNRRRKENVYGKIYSLNERFRFLERNAPELIVHDPIFDEILCEVPIDTIQEHYKPIEKLRLLRKSKKLENLEQKAMKSAEALKEAASIPWSTIGVSGSILVDLFTSRSDIDLVVYGTENCRNVYTALENLIADNESHFKSYNYRELRALFDFRSKDTMMTFEDFAIVESRKAFQGTFDGTDYFIRFVKDWRQIQEQYGDVCYKNSGYAKLTATIVDDSEALFTPCTYEIENTKIIEGSKLYPISEIVSYRGRFCKQAKINETVIAQGKIEHVTDTRNEKTNYRMIIGNKISDYMVLS